MFEALRKLGFDVLLLHHAEAILSVDMPGAEAELELALGEMKLPVVEMVGSGGGEALVTQRLRRRLTGLGWTKRQITIGKTIQFSDRDEPRLVEATTHEIDHVKAFGDERWAVALEIEWNNKDPFYDRDLENFKRLHAEGAISIGCLVTRGESLHANTRRHIRAFADDNQITSFDDLRAFGYDPTARQRLQIERRAEKIGSFREAWVSWFVSDKYGEATTHWRKLQDRVRRGVGNPCPLILIGIPDNVVTFDYFTAEL